LPIWANYTIGDVDQLSDVSSIQHTLFSVKTPADLKNVEEFLSHGTDAATLVVGRTGNLTVFDWNHLNNLRKPSSGIGKIHLGKDPSDLYLIPRKEMRQICSVLKERFAKGSRRFCSLLFDEYLFRHFDRIVDLEGYSFFIRNCYEYWRENLNLISTLRNERFLELYLRLQSPYEAKSSVSESGAVINGFVGCGSRVKGVVENSVIFHNVQIGKNTRVSGSVILPYNTIEDNAVIENALVLEGKDRIIERNTRIGGFVDVHNRDFPHLLKKGLSVVGQGVSLPRDSRIGAGCLLPSDGEKKLPTPFIMKNGTTHRAA
jgi:hypothetical protein